MIIPNFCLGVNAELSKQVPITVSEDGDEKIGVYCPYFDGKGERCLASVPTDKLQEMKIEVSEYPYSEPANKFPKCLYAEGGVRMV